MLIKNIFEQDIAREIEGVIKADDYSHITQEVKEYVITNEVEEKLDDFFRVYTKDISSKASRDTGVWVSGFFGSGKSHLLKILSYLLENREIDNKKTVDIFLNKIKNGDFELAANIKSASSIPVKTILFNIDQKADQINNHKEPVLSVMMKVFNEFSGYYHRNLNIAEFERNLDKLNLYEKFKENYKKVSDGETWEEDRRVIDLKITEFIEALSMTKNISQEDGREVFRTVTESQKSLSIEDFAYIIKDYIDKQPDKFRLIFLIDEVGQYISNDSHLMLNLQTIAETFGTICEGKAWLIVSSQHNLEAIVGDITKNQSQDFSKIMGRFRTKLNLTSKNVDEVIQKRLLAKTDEATEKLDKFYQSNQTRLKSIHFKEAGKNLAKVKDKESFIADYPFLPYQYELMQDAIIQLGRHNALLGKHQSFGERSMLEVYQLAAMELSSKEISSIAPFDLFFSSIKGVLKTEAVLGLNNAEKNDILKPFDLRVLKALFLVRYIDHFKTNVQHITTLLMDNVDTDELALEQNIKNSLEKLERNIYIQNIGGIYHYLTDEEKDIQEEIKEVDIEETEISSFLAEIIFNEIIGDTKFDYKPIKQSYSFTKKMDYRSYSKEHFLGLHFITPLYIEEKNLTDMDLKSESIKSNDIIARLPELENTRNQLRNQLILIIQTQKYIKKTSPSMSERKRLLFDQTGSQNNERKAKLIEQVKDLVNEARFYLNGEEIKVSNMAGVKNRLNEAFQKAVEVTFPKLKMLGNKIYKEDDVKEILFSGSDLFGTLTEGENEVRFFIERKRSGGRVTVKHIIENFTGNGYGWYQPAILSQIAGLYSKKKLMINYNSVELQDYKEIYKKLLNSKEFDSITVEIQSKVDEGKIAKAKEFYQKLFNISLTVNDQKDVYEEFRNKLKEEISKLEILIGKSSEYHFLTELIEPVDELKELARTGMNDFYDKIEDKMGHILDINEDVIEPVTGFMNSPQKQIYDDIKKFISSQQVNLEKVSDEQKIRSLKMVMEDRKPYRTGYMQKSKNLLEDLKSSLTPLINEAKKRIIEKARSYILKLEDYEDYKQISQDMQKEILKPFEDFIKKGINEELIPVINDKSGKLDELYEKQLKKIAAEFAKKSNVIPDEIVNIKKIKLSYKKTTLETADDVENYVKDLREKLLDEVNNKRKIYL